MTEEMSERLLTEAAARVTWGEPAETVVEFLTGNGMDYGEAARVVNQLVHERNAEVRARSMRRLGLGIAALLAAAIFFAFLPWQEWYESLNKHRRRRRSGPGDWMIIGVICLGIAGLWQAWRGIWGLITPQAEELSDVE